MLEKTQDERMIHNGKRVRNDDYIKNDNKLRKYQTTCSKMNDSQTSPQHGILKQLRLEAIFYPKFDEEARSSKKIRGEMLSNIAALKGYLEVTIKHSGSLLLWSGGQRFYSKNSTGTAITSVGEILLRQHFSKVWSHDDDGGNDANCSSDIHHRKYEECSRYVEEHRLTLSFEVVTAVLGHHGDIPHHDYLILIAVAERHVGTFLDTPQLVKFAHKFLLPHNDSWVFSSTVSAQKLFHLYDTGRETGLADYVISALTSAADGGYIKSMYSHLSFQGNILEGIVIRYVSFLSTTSPLQNTNTTCRLVSTTCVVGELSEIERIRQEQFQLLKQLDQQSQRNIALISKTAIGTPLFPPSSVNNNDHLARVNLRQLFSNDDNNDNRNGTNLENNRNYNDEVGKGVDNSFQSSLDYLLEKTDGKHQRLVKERVYYLPPFIHHQQQSILSTKETPATLQNKEEVLLSKHEQSQGEKKLICNDKIKVNDDSLNNLSLFTMTSTLLQSLEQQNQQPDGETSSIASLLQRIERLKLFVNCKFYWEKKKCVNDDITAQNNMGNNEKNRIVKDETSSSNNRLLCIIQLRHDADFQKYNKDIIKEEAKNNKNHHHNDMLLYRGFSIELVFGADNITYPAQDKTTMKCEEELQQKYHQPHQNWGLSRKSNSTTMLKMKFLPYMMRTFIFRDGLDVISEFRSAEALDRFSFRQMSKWGLSPNKIATWSSLIRSWGIYAHSQLCSKNNNSSCINQTALSKVKTSSTSTIEKNLPSLSTKTYLHHFNYFSNLYYSKKLDTQIENSGRLGSFRGSVVIVGMKDVDTFKISKKVATEIGACNVSDNINMITELDVILSVKSEKCGLVCSASVTDKAKNIRLLCKKQSDKIIIVLVGCSDDEIDAAFPNGIAKKKAKGMISNIWRKLICKKMIHVNCCELVDLSADKTHNKNVASFTRIPIQIEFENTIKILKEMSTLPEEGTNLGIIIFFPTIPGSGKTFLCSSISPHSFVDGEKTSTNQRKIIVRVSDDIKEAYYPLVLREKLEIPSSTYFVDKNSVPNAWPIIAEICCKSKNFAIPVLPLPPARKTTVIDFFDIGNVDEGGANKSSNTFSLNFPFSLHYLAVCILRVLERPMKGNDKQLVKDKEYACMIVIKYFFFYKNLTADNIYERMMEKINMGNAKTTNYLIQVPFFIEESLPSLPNDLMNALEDAIRLQRKLEKPKFFRIDNEAQHKMEQRMRSLLLKHAPFLKKLTVSESFSSDSFISQLHNQISSIDQEYASLKTIPICSVPVSFIKLVSVDVDMLAVHNILNSIAKESIIISDFLVKARTAEASIIEQTENGVDYSKNCERFISKTHLTMAHSSQLSQTEIRSTFGSLEGMQVELMINSFLFSDKNAALAASVSCMSIGENPLPLPQSSNHFSHITVWCANGVSSAESNNLPLSVKDGSAQNISFSSKSLNGTISFWK